MLYDIAKLVALPPACFFVLLLLGLLLKRWRPRLGLGFLGVLLVVVYFSTTPYLAGELMAPLQVYEPIDPEHPDPEVGAIIVLGAEVYFGAPEYWQPSYPRAYPDTAGSLSLQRVEYAAYLARMTRLPILVSGGASGPNPDITVARAMQQTLQRDFAVPVRWVEERSNNTFENARLTSRLLQGAGVKKAYLVTHAWHMRRAMFAFDSTQLAVIPAPTRFVPRAEPTWQDFLPSANAFVATYYATYEWLGTLWYRLER